MGAEIALPDPGVQSGPEILVFPADASRGDIIAELSTRIPQNEFGLPEFFFRSDLIQGYQLDDNDIDTAAVGLFYYEGYPALPNGSTFWNQLPHEPQSSFELFQKFLDQVEEIGIRQLDLLASACQKTVEQLSELSKEFYWSARARAYDLFIVAAEAKKRQHRIRRMENKHYSQAEKMLEKLFERFEGDFEDWIEELNAKEAAEVMEMLVDIQRKSVGLVGQHASSTGREFAAGESSESMIRKLAQGAGVGHSQGDEFKAALQHLLEDPEGGATIQAAVIKMTAGKNKQQFSEDM